MRLLLALFLTVFLVGCGVNTEPILAQGDGGTPAPGLGLDAGAAHDEDAEVDAVRFSASDAGPNGDAARVDLGDAHVEADSEVDATLADGAAADGAPAPGDAGGRDLGCDDGSPLECEAEMPACGEQEVAAVVGGCWLCVNVGTCRPWGEPGCATDVDCGAEDWCNACATGSCPFCDDCVSGCVPHGCETEAEPACDAVRPDCGDGEVSVLDGGCWSCVLMTTCSPPAMCADDHECGLASCQQMGEVCVAGTPRCAGGRCEVVETPSPNLYCRDGACARCQPGDVVEWSCPDGGLVPWCRCDAGGVLCIDDPSGACGD